MEETDNNNIHDAIYDADNLEHDVDMIDVEEGEFVESNSQNVLGQSSVGDITEPNQETRSENSKCGASKKKKKKNKRKRKGSGSGSNVMNIDRFVLDTCRRLKEKKSYMVYTAAGCLGISALSDIIKEVYAVQACGGQKTADGRRFRNGGGILWNIIKVREPNAYKEIMKRAKEFEKQFRQTNVKQLNVQKEEDSSQGVAFSFAGSDQGNGSDSAFLAPEMQNQHEPITSKEKSISVHDRLRIPVSYDDDLLGENPVNDAT
ncbi:phosphorylated adapter RNA export protein [Trifolium repens]|nr:phosphorylated adapter RNA export protein [Trifolium repens]